LQDALSAAAADPTLHPVEIWVAKGVYYPDVGGSQTNDDESATFIMSAGVALYGGFKFGDNNLTDRDPENNVTVLSGDLEQNDTVDPFGVVVTTTDIVDDNAYHVVSAKNVSGTAVLDGFTITAGQADGVFDVDGGGFICKGNDGPCSPTLKNIKFSGNYAEYDGGAMYNLGDGDGNSSPMLTNVVFSGNSAGRSGGAVYNYGAEGGSSSPTLTNVTFSGNSADEYGGALFNKSMHGGSSIPILEEVIFSGNSAGSDGGAIYNHGGEGGNSSPQLTKVTFQNNIANNGGALVNDGSDGNSSPIMTNITFTQNTSRYDGGAMFTLCDNGSCHPSLTGVLFSENHATRDGGAVYNKGDGGISNLKLTYVVFSSNSADDEGGAVVIDCDGEGECRPILTNVLFSGNAAGGDGGALYNDAYDGGTNLPVLNNVTFSGNAAGGDGGAMYNSGEDSTCSIKMRNSIVWNNMADGVTSAISASISNLTSTVNVSNSLVHGAGTSGLDWYGGSFIDGGGNIEANPMFITPVGPVDAPTTAGNLRLKTTSPAIDAGDNNYVPVGVTSDLDGEARIKDGTGDGSAAVDMGAYEAKGYFNLYVWKSGSGLGTVTSTPAGIDCGDVCSQYILESTSLTLEAVPVGFSKFTGWSGTCNGDDDCTLNIDSDTHITATFEATLKVDLPVIFR